MTTETKTAPSYGVKCTCQPQPLEGQRADKHEVELVHQTGCIRAKFLFEAFTRSELSRVETLTIIKVAGSETE
jgi:hypothetical protein